MLATLSRTRRSLASLWLVTRLLPPEARRGARRVAVLVALAAVAAAAVPAALACLVATAIVAALDGPWEIPLAIAGGAALVAIAAALVARRGLSRVLPRRSRLRPGSAGRAR
ncbi:MAG: hypothetical protein R3C15_24025 [Thermoleophilia bacterium]